MRGILQKPRQKPHRTLGAALAVAGLLAALPVARAGPIFFPGKFVQGKFVADGSAAEPCYTVRYSTITTTVANGVAATKIQETISGPSQTVAAVCLVPLPEGARGAEALVAAGIPNRDHAVLPTARFLPPAETQEVYESIARGLGSVKPVGLTGRAVLLVPEFQLQGDLEIVVEFQHPVEHRQGVRWLQCPMPDTEWAAGPVGRVSVVATLKQVQGEPLRAVFSPTHHATVRRHGPYEAVVRVKADRWSGSDDFRLCWVADKDPLGLRVLAYRPDADEDGYFMLLGNPTGSVEQEAAIQKDLIFVLDTSGSMRGEKIEQARAAIDYCIGQLNPGDRFNIVTFGTEVSGFRDAPVVRSEETLAAGRAFVEDVVAQGRTNISGALAKALAGQAQPGRPRITIFLTDGTPTAGELAPQRIVESVRAVRPSPTRIFVVGVGHDVNAHLLDKLAEITDGSSEYLEPDEEIDAKLAALYDRLSHPVLTDVLVDFGGLRTRSVYPQKLPALFKGSRIMILGRYRGGGRHPVTVSGTLAGRPASYRCVADLPGEPSGEANCFVAPLWAARKIGYLLQEIRLHGEEEELVAEVVRLSKRYGIVTEYTEFLAVSGPGLSTQAAVDEARRRMSVANTLQAGQWAVNQARNDRQLQMRVVATQGANNYLDRRGNLVSNDGIRQVGDQVFYLRDGQWVDAEEPGDRKTRVVELLSDEYLAIVRSNRQFARAQRLGWAVSGNFGDERIIVANQGRQQSEALRQQFRRQVVPERQAGQIAAPLNQLQQIPPELRNQLRDEQIDRRLNQRIRLDPRGRMRPPQLQRTRAKGAEARQDKESRR